MSNFGTIRWEPQSQPPQVGVDPVKFQIASNNDNATWNFVGPDNTPATYYTLADNNISNHNGNRSIRYKLFLSTDDDKKTPTVSDIFITFTTSCTPPGQAFFSGLASLGNYEITITHPSYQTWFDPSYNLMGDYQILTVLLNPL